MSEYVPLEVIAATAVVTAQAVGEPYVTLRFDTGNPPDRTYALSHSQAREVVRQLADTLARAEAEWSSVPPALKN